MYSSIQVYESSNRYAASLLNLKKFSDYPDVYTGLGDASQDLRHASSIIFAGGGSERRLKILYELKDKLESDFASNPDTFTPLLFTFFSGGYEHVVFEDDFYLYSLGAKVVLNIHSDENSSLEVHRLIFLLSMGCVVVSERSKHDPDIDSEYSDVVVFVDSVDDMLKTSRQLLHDKERRISLTIKAIEFSQSLMANTDSLQNALLTFIR
jgi:hypothetical protein